MKTNLTAISLLLATSIPGAIIAELLGLPLLTALDTGYVFSALVVFSILLIAIGDYSEAARPLAIRSQTAPQPTRIAPFTGDSGSIKLAA